MPTRPALPAMPELTDVPSPVLALVGAGDAAVEIAKQLPARLADADKIAADLREIDLTTLDPRKHDLTALDPRRIDPAAVTSTGLLWAAKATDKYTALVTRGEGVVAKMRSTDETVVDAEVPVAQPPVKDTVKDTAKDAAKPRTRKAAEKKADTDPTT